ncbi:MULTISPECIES: hypothetical protein [unclassified Pedobacter]|uniref:hypothetical protein n=1 Tax=unclassified Pedobacter TaxID=2628915 RepID=UPI001E4EC1A2|nr:MULTISPECIES: hypothetical protein [unclassified Pedobacter]
MKNLTQIINNFSDWEKPWTFYKSIMDNSNITEIEKEFFSKVYKEASQYELWNFTDLKKGAENSRQFLKKNTNFDQKAVNQIVNSIAYEWR